MDDSQSSTKRQRRAPQRYDSPPPLLVEKPPKKARKTRKPPPPNNLPPPPTPLLLPPPVEFGKPTQEADDSASSDIEEDDDKPEELLKELQNLSQSSLQLPSPHKTKCSIMPRPTKQSLLTRWITVTSTPRFPLFSKLPVELRLFIWELTIEPRILTVTTWNHTEQQIGASCPKVLALSVCRESRSAVIKSYPLAFGTWIAGERPRFNFEIDTLYLARSFKSFIHSPFFGALNRKDMQQLRYLAIDMTMCQDWYIDFPPGDDIPDLDDFQELLSPHIKQMVRLETVFEVYLLHHWAVHIDWLVDGQLKLHEKLPPHLNDPDLKIDEHLPRESEFFSWAAPKSQAVFGVLDGLVTAPGAPHRNGRLRSDEYQFNWIYFEEVPYKLRQCP